MEKFVLVEYPVGGESCVVHRWGRRDFVMEGAQHLKFVFGASSSLFVFKVPGTEAGAGFLTWLRDYSAQKLETVLAQAESVEAKMVWNSSISGDGAVVEA